MLAVDISAFNDQRRGEHVQRFLRAAMYDLLVSAFGRSGLPWRQCHREDRGDGALVIAPPGLPTAAMIDPLVDYLRAGIRQHNKICQEPAAIRLRMSVHAGQVYFDGNGVCGHAVNHLFRLLNAAAFKRAFADAGSDFALVTSDTLYADVISQAPGLIDPDMYAPMNIRAKETRARAWLYLPPVRNPFLHTFDRKKGLRQAAGNRARQRGKGAEARPRQGMRPQGPGSAPAQPTLLPQPRAAEPEDPATAGATRDMLVKPDQPAATRHWPPAGHPRTPAARIRFTRRGHPGQHLRHT